MTRSRPSFAIVGAGLGGLAVAATLRRAGFGVHVYEQAQRFARIGAGIQMMPNSMKVLRALGVEERIRGSSFEPYSHLNRAWDSGEVMRELPMPESLFGAPYLCMHRGDLHAALAAVVPAEFVHPGKKLVGLDQTGAQVTLTVEDGSRARRRVDWRRRRAFGGARRHHRPRHAASQRPDRLSGHLSLGACRPGHWPLEDEVVGNRPAHRHLLHAPRSQRNLLRHKRAGACRMADPRVVVGHR